MIGLKLTLQTKRRANERIDDVSKKIRKDDSDDDEDDEDSSNNTAGVKLNIFMYIFNLKLFEEICIFFKGI